MMTDQKRYSLNSRIFVLIGSIFLLVTACQPLTPIYTEREWLYTDLRALDAPDSMLPSQDLVALYTRTLNGELQIRLDLLDFSSELDYDLTIALDTRPGGMSLLQTDEIPGLGHPDLVNCLRPTTRMGLGNKDAVVGQDREWDYFLKIPASGNLTLQDIEGELQGIPLGVFRDPSLDTVTIYIDKTELIPGSAGFWIAAWSSPTGSNKCVDIIDSVFSDNLPPPQVPVLLTFWNTFNAVTPAQALRAWNGAHTGPFNDRHGLHQLLSAAQVYHFPIVLLDAKTPVSLSALDYVGGTELLQNLVEKGLVFLPDASSLSGSPLPGEVATETAYTGWAFAHSSVESRQVGLDNGVRASLASYGKNWFEIQLADLKTGDLLQYTDYAQSSQILVFTSVFSDTGIPTLALDQLSEGYLAHLVRWKNQIVVPIPMNWRRLDIQNTQQATRDGPSLELRQNLLSLASQMAVKGYNDSSLFLLLGGDLGRSSWGDITTATNTFLYLNSHPWIKPLTPEALLTLPPAQPDILFTSLYHSTLTGSLSTTHTSTSWITAGDPGSNPNPITTAIDQMEAALHSPTPPEIPALPYLRSNYLGQIGHLLVASRWAELPPDKPCGDQNLPVDGSCFMVEDSDGDGQQEYLLASATFFGVFKSQGGYLTTAWIRNSSGIHQIVAPTWQFNVGLSDPTTWDLHAGLASDPGQLRGAFSDIPAGYAGTSWQESKATLIPGQITFTTSDGKLTKTIHLTSFGLHVEYQASYPLIVQIPLAIDPWVRFKPGWGDLYQEIPCSSPDAYCSKVYTIDPQVKAVWGWELKNGPQIAIGTTSSLNPYPFTVSRDLMYAAEDPFYDYTRGHYLPFPFALVEVQGEGKFSIYLLF